MTISKTIITNYRLELTKSDLLQLLNCGPRPIPEGVRVPRNADVHIRVPGGGDWSSTNLDVEDDRPIVIEWEVKES